MFFFAYQIYSFTHIFVSCRWIWKNLKCEVGIKLLHLFLVDRKQFY